MAAFFTIESNALNVIHGLNGFNEYAQIQLEGAMSDSLSMLKQEAISIMQDKFKNYTGHLAGGFSQDITQEASSITGELINDIPYAWRREAGFSGMTDSLGRHFTDDPGIYYMNDSLSHLQLDILERFVKALNMAVKYTETFAALGATPTTGGTP